MVDVTIDRLENGPQAHPLNGDGSLPFKTVMQRVNMLPWRGSLTVEVPAASSGEGWSLWTTWCIYR